VLSGNSASGVCVPLMHERNARSSLAGLIGMRRSAPHTAVQPPAGQEPGEPQGITLLTEALGPEHPRPQTAGAPSVLPPEQEEPSPNVLRLLFLFDPGALEEALEGISSTSSSWTGVVQVPHNLKRHLRAVARHQVCVNHTTGVLLIVDLPAHHCSKPCVRLWACAGSKCCCPGTAGRSWVCQFQQ
jgi:hypothetical protein